MLKRKSKTVNTNSILLIILALLMLFALNGCKKENSNNIGDSNTASMQEQKDNVNVINKDMGSTDQPAALNLAINEINVDTLPAQFIKNLKFPKNTLIEIWSVVTNWSGGFDKMQYTVNAVSKQSFQEIIQYYENEIEYSKSSGNDEVYKITGKISDYDYIITLRPVDRIITDDEGKEGTYITSIEMFFPLIKTTTDNIAFKNLYTNDVIKIYEPDSCALIGISHTRAGAEIKLYSTFSPEDVYDYYYNKMKDKENFNQEGDTDIFERNIMFANVQLMCTDQDKKITVTIMKNQNEETIDTYKSGYYINISN